MPSFSVIVRTRDRPWFLARALRSIVAQKFKGLQAVVVNDGGDAAALEPVLAEARTAGLEILVLDHEKPLGRGGAWNAGIRAASGDWLAALDDDDTWATDFIFSVSARIAAEALAGSKDFGVVSQTTEIVERANSDGWSEESRRAFNPRLQEVRVRDLVLLNRFTNNAFVFPKSAFETVGPIREDFPVLEDWEFNVRFAERFPVFVIPRQLANYHRRPQDGSSAANTDLELHNALRERIRETWMRADLASGRFGLGVLGVLAEIEANRGLRLGNRVASWFGY